MDKLEDLTKHLKGMLDNLDKTHKAFGDMMPNTLPIKTKICIGETKVFFGAFTKKIMADAIIYSQINGNFTIELQNKKYVKEFLDFCKKSGI